MDETRSLFVFRRWAFVCYSVRRSLLTQPRSLGRDCLAHGVQLCHQGLRLAVCEAKGGCALEKLAAADDVLTGHRLQQRPNGQAQEARLLGVSLAGRALSATDVAALVICDLRLYASLRGSWLAIS